MSTSVIQNVAAIIWHRWQEKDAQRLFFLLQKKTPGYEPARGKWVLFGGEVKPDERPKEAIVRELKEELQAKKADLDPLEIVSEPKHAAYDHFFKTDGTRIERQVFSCEINTPDTSRPLSDIQLGEGAGFALFAEKQLDTYRTFVKGGDDPNVMKGDFLRLKKFNPQPTTPLAQP